MADHIQKQYQMIHYHGANFKFTIWGIDYIPPQFHREIEIWIILHGKISLNIDGDNHKMKKGDFCIIDSFKIHEVKSDSEDEIPMIMVMHIHSDFFEEYYPAVSSISFPFAIYNSSNMDERKYYDLIHQFYQIGIAYFKKEKHYQLYVAGMINLFFANILELVRYDSISEEEKRATIIKTARLKRITDYIYEHYSEKLLLSDLAMEEGISMSRLSHLFKECFGKSFQEYLMRVRCEKAKELLRATDITLLDISMSCGFSDPKYFNQGFKKIYGRTPKEYRKHHKNKSKATNISNKDIIVKTGSFLTDEDCYLILEYCDDQQGVLELI